MQRAGGCAARSSSQGQASKQGEPGRPPRPAPGCSAGRPFSRRAHAGGGPAPAHLHVGGWLGRVVEAHAQRRRLLHSGLRHAQRAAAAGPAALRAADQHHRAQALQRRQVRHRAQVGLPAVHSDGQAEAGGRHVGQAQVEAGQVQPRGALPEAAVQALAVERDVHDLQRRRLPRSEPAPGLARRRRRRLVTCCPVVADCRQL